MDNALVAHALFDTMETRSHERFLSFFTQDATIWHNFDPVDRPVAEATKGSFALFARLRQLKYEDRRYEAVPNGVIVQHTVRLTMPDGQVFDLRAMQRVHMVDGLIRRVEEYFDMKQVEAAQRALSHSERGDHSDGQD